MNQLHNTSRKICYIRMEFETRHAELHGWIGFSLGLNYSRRVASCEKRCRVAKSGLQVALQCRLSTLAFRVCTSAASVVMAWRMGSKRPGAKGKSLRGQVHPLANQDPQHSPQ